MRVQRLISAGFGRGLRNSCSICNEAAAELAGLCIGLTIPRLLLLPLSTQLQDIECLLPKTLPCRACLWTVSVWHACKDVSAKEKSLLRSD